MRRGTNALGKETLLGFACYGVTVGLVVRFSARTMQRLQSVGLELVPKTSPARLDFSDEDRPLWSRISLRGARPDSPPTQSSPAKEEVSHRLADPLQTS